MILVIGETIIDLHDGHTVTSIPGVPKVIADHNAQPGQEETAALLGYGTNVRLMNVHHDITHALIAHWLGLPFSPTLYAVASKSGATDAHRLEEEAVLAVQKLARAYKIDLVDVARRISRGS